MQDTKLHYVESGCKDQPLVLLLHGFPDCWLSWRYQIPELSKNFRVVAVDLKGFGDSDKPSWRKLYRIKIIVSEMEQLIHALGVTKCIVIGHDLGATIGWFLCHKSPELITKFVAISCPHPNVYWQYLNDNFSFNSKWVLMTQLPYLPEIDALKEDLSIINRTYPHLTKNVDDLEAYKYTFSRKEDWTGPINYYRNLPFCRINERNEQNTVHTLLVIGNKDPAIQMEGIIKSTDYCEKFLVKIVDGTGHFPHQQNPELCNTILMKFLITKDLRGTIERQPSKGLMNRMFGAVSSTVKYGNSVLDTVHKTTNGIVSNATPRTLFLAHNQ